MYVRGPGGGAILNDNGSLSKLDIKADGMVSGSVYFAFSPSGRFITFSSNVIIPAFHSQAAQRMEVYDSASDIYVADLQSSRIMVRHWWPTLPCLRLFPRFLPMVNTSIFASHRWFSCRRMCMICNAAERR